jgi:hypothetical protein
LLAQGDLGHASRFFTTIAVQLAKALPAVMPYICEAIVSHPKIAQQGLSEQWKYLILQPLSILGRESLQLQTFVLVIDALDECNSERDIRLILRLLAEAETLETVRLRVFVTSRPETSIRLGFREIPEINRHDLVLHSIPRPVIKHDISIFLRHELANIKEDKSVNKDWPSEEEIHILLQKADRLFIYATAVCHFIRKSRFPERRLSEMLRINSSSHSPMRKLDNMYRQILDHSMADAFDKDKEDIARLFKQIVGSIIVLFDTLSSNALTKLLAVSSAEMELTLDPLHSILDIPQDKKSPIKPFHLSFRDFLLSQERCFSPHFWVDEKMVHYSLVKSCLKAMSNTLRRDICSLQMLGAIASEVERSLVDQCLPDYIQYACRYWIDHLQQSDIELYDNGQLHKLLGEHFLHWLEALSLIGSIPNGVVIVSTLESMLIVSDSITI